MSNNCRQNKKPCREKEIVKISEKKPCLEKGAPSPLRISHAQCGKVIKEVRVSHEFPDAVSDCVVKLPGGQGWIFVEGIKKSLCSEELLQ